MAVFLYNSYWRTWTRVLLESMNREGICVEINLTHINGHWDRVPLEIIRRHTTNRGVNDRLTNVLPLDIQAAIKHNVGEELYKRLLTYDYLPEIDWQKYDKICNGGAEFAKVRRTFKE